MKWLKVILVMVGLGLGAAVLWQAASLRQPTYQGKRLSEWLKASPVGQYSGPERALMAGRPRVAERDVDEAVRQMGTNAIPVLLRLIQAKDSPLKLKVMDLLGRQHLAPIEYTSAEELNCQALCAFAALGPKALSALPALEEIARRNVTRESQSCAIAALGTLGRPAIPFLLEWAASTNTYCRFDAVAGLGKEREESAQVVPALVSALRDPQPVVRYGALKAIEGLRTNAAAAASAVLELLSRPQPPPFNNRTWVGNALRIIDPEAAARAGVKCPAA